MKVKCDSVYKIFDDDTIAVNNASFEVQKGEMLVVMGPSGAGKTTLLRCVSGLTPISAGKIFIDGENLLTLTDKELIKLRRNKMGM